MTNFYKGTVSTVSFKRNRSNLTILRISLFFFCKQMKNHDRAIRNTTDKETLPGESCPPAVSSNYF